MDDNMPMEKLLDVQRIDLHIQSLETEASAIPRQIKEWDSTLDAKRAEAANLRQEIEEKKKDQRHLERLLEQKQIDLSKYNAKLPMIKTNREYKAILLEVDMVEKEISDLEERLLMKMDEVEEIEKRTEGKEIEVTRTQESIDKEKEKLQQRKQEVEESLRGTRSERESVAASVDETLLTRYNRIRLHKGGLAIANIQGESCGACHMALPPQLVNEVIGGKIRSCPSCSRLLYWDEEV